MVEGLTKALLVFSEAAILIFTLVHYFFKYKSKSIWFRLTPLSIVVATSLIVFFGQLGNSETFKSKTVIYAEIKEHLNINSIRLREDFTYQIKKSYVEWTCYFDGTYKRDGDTVIFNLENGLHSENIFHQKYLITKEFLMPIENNQIMNDSLKFLRILPE